MTGTGTVRNLCRLWSVPASPRKKPFIAFSVPFIGHKQNAPMHVIRYDQFRRTKEKDTDRKPFDHDSREEKTPWQNSM